MSESTPLTLGDVARHYRIPEWRVRRLYERGILPPARRIGHYRIIPADELPTVEAALRSVGYLPAAEAQPCA